MCPKPNPAPPGSDGDMGSINAFPSGWQPSGSSVELWDHEAILLEAGDILYVQYPI
jgi:hypothetical protein